MGSKVVALAVSTILLVAVVIGVAVAVGRSNHKVGQSFNMPEGGGDDGVSTTSKSVTSMCAVTDHKEACEKSLGSVLGNNGSVSIQDIVKVAMEVSLNASAAAFEKVKESFDHATLPNVTVDEQRSKAAISDCQELIRLSAFQLKKIMSSINSTDVKSLQEKSNDVNVWLSAAISYHWMCVDAVEHPELKAQMEKIVVDSSELAENALSIVTDVASTFAALEGLHIPLKTITPGENRRKLLQANGLDEEGYPTWLPQSDRRLLGGASVYRPKPNVVVAKDGSGNFKTISAAINAMPNNNNGRYVIYVKAGVYNENVVIDEKKTNIFMYGDGPRRTIVTGRKNYVDGTPTFATATFAVVGDGFMCQAMGFQNTAGPMKHQAVALRLQSDRAVFYNCRMDAYQDTLYVQSQRQFFRNCVISGTVDFIFGASAAVIQNSLIVVRRPMDNQQNIVTAHGRTKPDQNTAIVIHNCRIVPEQKLFAERFKIRSYLGRPWKEYARTVVMETTIGDLIQPEGWFPWDGDFALKTLYYAEYANRGPGARTTGRVKWPGYKGVISRNEASKFTAGAILSGNTWMRATGVPHLLGFRS